MSEIENISVDHIYPHPENPRKDLGDLAELAESIKKNGIMQNLTVMPKKDSKGDYIALIGHRRSAAAKLAGLKEVPCRIVDGLSVREQMAIMLEENMQRNDLTVWEQANRFQMMLDIGETEQTIADKTGFSRATVRHRINLAKLNPALLKRKEEGFQLSLTDFYELEKVKDVEQRNQLLEKANDSADLRWHIKVAVREEKKAEVLRVIVPKLEALGIKKAPSRVKTEIYQDKWKVIKEFSLDEGALEEVEELKNVDGALYLETFSSLKVIKEAKKAKAKKKTAEEIKREKIAADKKRISEILKAGGQERFDFVKDVISGKIKKLDDERKVEEEIFDILLDDREFLTRDRIASFFLKGAETYCVEADKAEEAKKKVDKLGMFAKMLCLLSVSSNGKSIVDYTGHYDKRSGETIKRFCKILEKYGYSHSSEEEKAIVYGTSELYVVEDEPAAVEEE